MFKFHPLGCKIQLLEPRYLIGAGADFVKINDNSPCYYREFLLPQNLKSEFFAIKNTF